MFRLIAYARNGVKRFPLGHGETVIGSAASCDVRLEQPGVLPQHLLIRRDDSGISIEALSDSDGVVVNGASLQHAVLQPLDEIHLEGITLLLEDGGAGPAEPLQAMRPQSEGTPRLATPEGMTRHLAAISRWVMSDTDSRVTLETLVKAILDDFGGGMLVLCHGGEPDNPGIKFVVATQPRWLTHAASLLEQIAGVRRTARDSSPLTFEGTLDEAPCRIYQTSVTALDRLYTIVTALPGWQEKEWSALPAFQALGDQIVQGLVHHVGRYEPILPGQGSRQDLHLAPGFIVGESKAMSEAIDKLRTAGDPLLRILFRGEAGSGREALARTAHLSSPRSQGPFLSISCEGADPKQIEADLFGAIVGSGSDPLFREAKLALADGGTLLLEEPEHLPLEIQARLVRFLRTGVLDNPEGQEVRAVDVRLLVSSQVPLEPLVAADRFRVDLAYRLSELVIDVPALRQRREDIPLLIQGSVNRFCHETGKRVAGITVKAMSALATYDFPGNLKELENIARQLVYLCPPGQPADLNLLPAEVRLSGLGTTPRVDESSDLNLEKLVASCEAAAIREALRRSQDNKSEAARLLGVSRNGLAMKIKRYAIGSQG